MPTSSSVQCLLQLESTTRSQSPARTSTCNSPKVRSRHSPEAERVIALLDSVGKADCYLFGHQDDLFYGHHWSFKDADVTDSSDTRAVCGDYPGIIGAEIGGLELGKPISLDSVPFDLIRSKAVEQYGRGGLITVSWHPYSPVSDSNAWYLKDTNVVSLILHDSTVNAKFRGDLQAVADFFGSIMTADGKLVPIIFRPWHEMNYSWFWWGKKFCADSEYVALYRMTVDFMIGVALAAPVANKVGKKATFIVAMALAALLSIVFYQFKPDQIALVLIFQVFISICAGSIFPLLWSMYADIVDYQELKTGRRATGLIFSSSSMSQKFGWALGTAVTGWLLSAFGYNSVLVNQSARALNGIRLMMSWLPAAGCVIAIVAIFFYPLGDKKMQEVTSQLNALRASHQQAE